jgi:cardiolipin synthase A/B
MDSGKRIPIAVILLLAGTTACARMPTAPELPGLTVEDGAFLPTMEAYAGAAARRGNRLDLLLNGDQIFPAQLKAIRSAKKTITYAQYFYEDGPPARDIVEAIAERCLRGVRGHVLLDGAGSINMPPEFREKLEKAGCEVAIFHPLESLAVYELDNRNHRRILVVDGRIGFTGGSGASSKWMGNGLTQGQWRQTDVRVEGPVVGDLQAAFVENWREATGRSLGGEGYFEAPAQRGNALAQVVRSSPASGSFALYTMFLLAISSARQQIYITNPYFVPDGQMMDALVGARRRGVRVVLLLPGKLDHEIVREAGRAGFGRLLEAGAEIYEYSRGLLHAKTMTVDGRWATVGSANLDSRSLARNDEINLVTYGAEQVAPLDRIFAEDLRNSRRVDIQSWQARGLWDRFREWLSLPIRKEI